MRAPSSDEARELREYFLEIDYCETQLHERLGSVDAPTRLDATRSVSLDRTQSATPWNALIRLFFLGTAIGAPHSRTLPPRILELCADLGLLEAGEQIRPTCLLYPFRDSWIAADRYPLEGDGRREDHVLTAGPVARHLSYFTTTEFLRASPTSHVLDHCVGGGVHAIRLAEVADSVVGTDLNPRALEFARFNAALAGHANVEFLEGDRLRPVAGRKFDLVVCNPPFVLTPSAEWVSTDNPDDLDHFCEDLIRTAPDHLTENGRLQMIFEWVELEGQDWRERLASWVAGLDCDAWFIHANQETPLSYTQRRIRELSAVAVNDSNPSPKEDWLSYYADRRVRAIHGGFLLLRKRSGRNWIRFSEVSGNLTPRAGLEVERMLHLFDRIESVAQESAFLERYLHLRDGVEREDVSKSEAGVWQRSITRLRSGDGLPQEAHVDPTMADLLGQFQGTETVAQVIQSFADARGATRPQVESECVRIIRHFLERGWLEFVEQAPVPAR